MTSRLSPREDVHDLLAIDLPPVRPLSPEGGSTLPEASPPRDDEGGEKPRKDAKQ